MDPRLDFARELEQRDTEVGERLEVLGRLAGEVDRIREDAVELVSVRERLPAERQQVASALAEAEAGLQAAHDALAVAERSGGDRAESELAAARAAVAAAEEGVRRTAGRQAALEREIEEAQARAASLGAAAAAAARALEAAPRVRLAAAPGGELAAVLDWAARAHAAILVARSGLDAERDRIFREANELGSSVLGEPLQSTNVAVVRRRVEERLGART
jgi:DNA repair exonuclease SbcCD ATPase subunit